jgi:hypothetical protein
MRRNLDGMTAITTPGLIRRSRIALLVAMLVAGLIAVIAMPEAVPALAAISSPIA